MGFTRYILLGWFAQRLWDSQRLGVQFQFNKFDPPVIDGGQISVPNYNVGVDLYRLTQQ